MWLPGTEGPVVPTPYVYAWDETTAARAGSRVSRQLPPSAMDYVRTFDWDPSDVFVAGREPYFNLTVVDSDPLRSTPPKPT